MLLGLLILLFILLFTLLSGAATVALTAMATSLAPVLCYGAGLALTLALAARLTPAGWWRRPTVRGLAIVAGGTWLCGSALALATGAAPAATVPAGTASSVPATTRQTPGSAATGLAYADLPKEPALPAEPFRVHRSLNLRAGPDVGSARLAVIPVGARLTPTGKRSGDWWQVHADTPGGAPPQTGWVSSLWLRQLAERQH